MGDSGRVRDCLAISTGCRGDRPRRPAGTMTETRAGTTGADRPDVTAGGDEGGTTAEGGGEPILIKTHVVFLENPTAKVQTKGEVLSGSTIGDGFCAGGTFSDGHGEPPLGLVVKTIRCPGGRLTITFSPTEPSLKQSADWEVVDGSGSLEGLSGEGGMTAVFESKAGEGRETFTGTVTRKLTCKAAGWVSELKRDEGTGTLLG